MNNNLEISLLCAKYTLSCSFYLRMWCLKISSMFTCTHDVCIQTITQKLTKVECISGSWFQICLFPCFQKSGEESSWPGPHHLNIAHYGLLTTGKALFPSFCDLKTAFHLFISFSVKNFGKQCCLRLLFLWWEGFLAWGQNSLYSRVSENTLFPFRFQGSK